MSAIFGNKACTVELVGPFAFGRVGFRRVAGNPEQVEMLFYDKGGFERVCLPDGRFRTEEREPGWVTREVLLARKQGRSLYWKKTEGPRHGRGVDLARALVSHLGAWGHFNHPHDVSC